METQRNTQTTGLIGFRSDLDPAMIEKINWAIDQFKPEAAEIVAAEPKNPTTENNYGYYMSVFSRSGAKSGLEKTVLANALLRADGNYYGIMNALALVS